MRRLNYHHLLYFWTVVREGTIAKACAQLHLTQPTISGQLRSLERAIGAKLFARMGRNLVPTETGRTVYRYADEIFSLGQELEHTLDGHPPNRPLKFLVGVADTLPKEIAYRILEPALTLPEPLQVVCDHGQPEYLLARLAVNALDVVLADAPVPPSSKVRAFNHLLGESGLSFMGTPKLASSYRRRFPASLNGAPFLLPGEGSVLRRSLEQWFDAEGIRPLVRGEFVDPGLLKVFGQNGIGIFAVRSAVERETRRQYGVQLIGRVESIRERFYAISVERRLKHPAVVAITTAARNELFAR
jgi:LysR family transcriptional regulator, transcriptional activator of nhaA